MNFIKTSGAVATGVVAASLIVGTFNLIANKMSKSEDKDTSKSSTKKAGRPKKSAKSNSKSGK